MNRTILEKARCMLSNVGLVKEFWAEACNTAVYLINRSPSSWLDFGIPEEEWMGKKISYSHIQVFGCEAYVHVPKEKRKKLDPKSQKGIFLGYGEDQFGFRIWDPVGKKIIRSRDVVFNEKVFPTLHKEENMICEYAPFFIFDNNCNVDRDQNTISPSILSPTSVLAPTPLSSSSTR